MIDPHQTDFATVSDMIRQHAQAAPMRLALAEGSHTLSYGALDVLMDRVAAALQRDGLQSGDSIALCAQACVNYAAVFLGALRAGVVVAPLAPGSTRESLVRMVRDADAKLVFTDAASRGLLGDVDAACVMLNEGLNRWLGESGVVPKTVALEPTWVPAHSTRCPRAFCRCALALPPSFLKPAWMPTNAISPR